MPIPPVGSASAPVTPEPPKQSLDSEVFLELLVTQLRNQDPSSPMDTSQMIAQTTQLATMEQLTKLTTLTEESFSLQMRAAAADLLGRQVSYLDADGAEHTGLASAVAYTGQVPTVLIGTERIALDAVTAVAPTTS